MPALTFSRWPDEVIATCGFAATDPYVETFWLPVLGPSQIALLRKVNRGLLDDDVDVMSYEDVDLAREIGLGGNLSSLLRTIKRLEQFEMLQVAGAGEFRIRTHLPPLARRHLMRLPAALAALCIDQHRVPA